MANRTARIKGENPVLHLYEIDDDFMKNEALRIKVFSSIPKEIAAFIVEDEYVEYDEALRRLYSSKMFEKLADKETGLYRDGAAYVYQYYLEEKEWAKKK